MGHFRHRIPPVLASLDRDMKILLTDIRDSARDVRITGRLQLPGFEDRMGEGTVEVDVRVNPAGERWYLRARVWGEFNFVCDRCRSEYEDEIEGEFTLIVLSKAVRGLEEDEHEEVVLLPNDSNELDLSEKVREAMMLALPIQFLCGEECAGLDPGTGDRLKNEDSAGEVDPRWAALLDLKDKLEKQSASSPERQE